MNEKNYISFYMLDGISRKNQELKRVRELSIPEIVISRGWNKELIDWRLSLREIFNEIHKPVLSLHTVPQDP